LRLLPEYRREWFRFDALAGLTTAAVVIPKSMAYATIAGLLGSSRVMGVSGLQLWSTPRQRA
jgi:MFS superfamily sulfate permease-like transporter